MLDFLAFGLLPFSCVFRLITNSSPVSRTKHGSGQRWPLLCFHRVRQGNVLLYAIGMIGSCFTPAGSRPARRYRPALPAGTARLPIGQTGGQSNDAHLKVEWRWVYHDIRGRNGLDSVRSQKRGQQVCGALIGIPKAGDPVFVHE